MTGWPLACAATTLALICSNWALRSGWCDPSSVLRLNWRENPSFTSSLRTVSGPIGCPISVSSAASFSRLFETQIKGRIGSPSVAGSTRRLSAGIRPGSLSQSARRPPPARRTRPFGSGSASRSSSPRLIVERASPVLIEMRAHRLPALPNRSPVDHATDLRRFAAHRNPQGPSHSAAGPQIAIQLMFGLSLAFATISLAVGFASVHAALNDQPWPYIPLWFGQYINLLGLPFFIGTIFGAIWALPSKKRQRKHPTEITQVRSFES